MCKIDNLNIKIVQPFPQMYTTILNKEETEHKIE